MSLSVFKTQILGVEATTKTSEIWVNRYSTLHGSLLPFSHYVITDSLRPLGLQLARLPCPSLSPGVCPNSCPSSCWCRPAISSSVAPSPFAFNLSQCQGLDINQYLPTPPSSRKEGIGWWLVMGQRRWKRVSERYGGGGAERQPCGGNGTWSS